MPRYGLTGQMVMTTPILEGTDARYEEGKIVGKKMSKSADNYVGMREDPLTQYRKIMQVGDDVIFRYFELLSSRSNAEISALKEDPGVAGRFARGGRGNQAAFERGARSVHCASSRRQP